MVTEASKPAIIRIKTDEKVNIINMRNKEEKYVLRFCASILSVPKNAKNVQTIFGYMPTGNQMTYNKLTGLPFGFSYEIEAGNDTYKYRKIEIDIINNKREPLFTDNNYYSSYDEFVKYYDDEVFPEPVYTKDDLDDSLDEEYIDEEEYDQYELPKEESVLDKYMCDESSDEDQEELDEYDEEYDEEYDDEYYDISE